MWVGFAGFFFGSFFLSRNNSRKKNGAKFLGRSGYLKIQTIPQRIGWRQVLFARFFFQEKADRKVNYIIQLKKPQSIAKKIFEDIKTPKRFYLSKGTPNSPYPSTQKRGQKIRKYDKQVNGHSQPESVLVRQTWSADSPNQSTS